MKAVFYFCLGWAIGAVWACWMIGEYDTRPHCGARMDEEEGERQE